MAWKTNRNFIDRFSSICSADGDDNGSGADSGGGGGVVADSGTPGPSSAAPSGGQVQQNADHSGFNTSPPSADHATRVRGILDAGAANKEHTLSMDDIADLIRFDAPLKPINPAPVVPANAATVPPTPPAAPATPATPQAPANPQISPDAAALINALRQALPQAPAPTNPTPEPAPAPKPYYGGDVPALQVSPQILQGLLGTDDPGVLATAAPAVNTLVNGIMNRVMEDSSLRMQAMAAALMRAVPTQVQQVNAITNNEQKFYSKFTELRAPAFKSTVDAISALYVQAKQRQNPNFTWTEEAFQECGELVHRKLEKDLGFAIPRPAAITKAPAAPAAPSNSVPANPAPQPYIARGSARPSAADPTRPQSADLVAFVI